MIMKQSIFNNHTLNIFTDASILKLKNETVSSSGSIVILNNDIIDEDYQILRNSTNNIGEASSVRLGILHALKYRCLENITTINLFCDSQITIFGIREWIFNWVNCVRNGVMLSSSGNPVANQSILLEIIYMILNNKLYINFFHLRGHKSINSQKDIDTFITSFKKNNFVKSDLDINLVKSLIQYNDIVDNNSRDILLKETNMDSKYPKLQQAVEYRYQEFDIDKYKEYINYG